MCAGGKNVTVFDLAAYDMQRSADLGVGTLNDVRAIFDLDPVKEWTDITTDAATLQVLQAVYATPAEVDGAPGRSSSNSQRTHARTHTLEAQHTPTRTHVHPHTAPAQRTTASASHRLCSQRSPE